MVRSLVVVTVLSAGVVCGGCGQTLFPADLDTTLEAVDLIRDNDSLEPQEKREELGRLLGVVDINDQNEMGVILINGLLDDERLANQFGGDLSSAYGKVRNDQLGEMTPDEVQFYGDATDITEYEDTEAQAIAEFFKDPANEIGSVEDLEDFLDDAGSAVPAAIDETFLRDVFVTTELSTVRDKLP